jgi:hypothetical protein
MGGGPAAKVILPSLSGRQALFYPPPSLHSGFTRPVLSGSLPIAGQGGPLFRSPPGADVRDDAYLVRIGKKWSERASPMLIHIFAVPHFYYSYNKSGILYLIENPVDSNTQAVPLVTGKLFTPRWARICLQKINPLHNALNRFGRNGFEVFVYRTSEQDTIVCHRL